jgi:hypothetical protein
VWIALVPWLIGHERASLVEAGLMSIAFALGLCLPLGAWIPDTATGGFGAEPLGAHGLCLAIAAASTEWHPHPASGCRARSPRRRGA